MSKAHPQNILKSVDPVGKKLFQPQDQGGVGLTDYGNLYGYGPGATKPNSITPVAEPTAPTNADIQARTADFATLDQQMGQRAAGAGAVRNENQADVLGYAPPAKRRTASRTLLG